MGIIQTVDIRTDFKRIMNVFRLAGDLSHLLAIVILLLKIHKTKSCAGISGKTQILFSLVFITRYIDLFTVYISAYNSVMKLIYLICSISTCYFIYIKFRPTYNSENDKFRVEFVLVPAAGLAFLVNHHFEPIEILWTFSIYLEAIAIMPQLQISATPERPRLSPATTCSSSDPTEPSTWSTG